MDLKYFIMPNKRKRVPALILLLCFHLGALINQASSTDKPAQRAQSSQLAGSASGLTVVVGQPVELECQLRPEEERPPDEDWQGGVPRAHLIDAELARGQPEVAHQSRADSIQLILWYHSGQNESGRLQQQPIYSVDARWRPAGQQAPREQSASQPEDDRLVPVGQEQLNYYYRQSQQQQQANRNNASLWKGRHYAAAKLASRLALLVKPELERAYLRIERAELADSGLYRCRVDYERARTRYQLSQLKVISPLSQVQIAAALVATPADQAGQALQVAEPLEVNEDQPMRLECEARDGSPGAQLLWWRLDWPPTSGGGVAAAPRLTQLSGAPQERRSVLLSAAGSAGLPPTPLSRPSHLALWMSEHLRALLEPEQQDQDLDEQVPEGELAKRLNQTLSGHSRASRHFWQLLASRRMVAFVCGASNTFAIAGSTAPDKLSQIRPLFRSILVGQANAKPRAIQIYLVSQKQGQQGIKLTRLDQGQSLHLNLADEPSHSDKRQLRLACQLAGFWPKATLEWTSSRLDQASTQQLISEHQENDIEASTGQVEPSENESANQLWPQLWSSIRVHNISIREHRSIIKCTGRNDLYSAKVSRLNSLGKQRAGSSIISDHADHDELDSRDELAHGRPLGEASLATWIRLNITHAPLVQLSLPTGRNLHLPDRARPPKQAQDDPIAVGQICGRTSRDGGLSGADNELDKCGANNRPAISATLSSGESVILTCSITFANPALIEPIEWSFRVEPAPKNGAGQRVNDTWKSISQLEPLASARVLPEQSRQAEDGALAAQQMLEIKLAQADAGVWQDSVRELWARCAARNQLGSTTSEQVQVLVGSKPRCEHKLASAPEASETYLTAIQCPVISDHNSSTYRYHYYYYYRFQLKSGQTTSESGDSNEKHARDNKPKQVYESRSVATYASRSFISHSPVIQMSDLRPADSLSVLYNSLFHDFDQEIVIKCSAVDKFGSNDNNPCQIRVHRDALVHRKHADVGHPIAGLAEPSPKCLADLMPNVSSSYADVHKSLESDERAQTAVSGSKLILNIDCSTNESDGLQVDKYSQNEATDESSTRLSGDQGEDLPVQLGFDLYRRSDATLVKHLATLTRAQSPSVSLQLEDEAQLGLLDELRDEYLVVVRATGELVSEGKNLTIAFKRSRSGQSEPALPSSSSADQHHSQGAKRSESRAGHHGAGSGWVISSRLVYGCSVLALVIICYVTAQCGNKSGVRFNRFSRSTTKRPEDPETSGSSSSAGATANKLVDNDGNFKGSQAECNGQQQVQPHAASELLYLVGGGGGDYNGGANSAAAANGLLASSPVRYMSNARALHLQAAYHNSTISVQAYPARERPEIEQADRYALHSLSPSASPINVLIIDSLASDSSQLSATPSCPEREQEQPALLVLDQCAEHAGYMGNCHLQARLICAQQDATLRQAQSGQLSQHDSGNNSNGSSSSTSSGRARLCRANNLGSQHIRLPPMVGQLDAISPASANNIELSSLGELTITDESLSFIHDSIQGACDQSASVRRRTLASGSPPANHNDLQNKSSSQCVECQRIKDESSSLLKLNQELARCQCYGLYDLDGPQVAGHLSRAPPASSSGQVESQTGIRLGGARNKTGNERVRFLDY